MGKRPEAVSQLETAHRLFSDLGADPYVRRCAGELELMEVSAATESPAGTLGLSRAEMAVARLVATGLTNREVAGERNTHGHVLDVVVLVGGNTPDDPNDVRLGLPVLVVPETDGHVPR